MRRSGLIVCLGLLLLRCFLPHSCLFPAFLLTLLPLSCFLLRFWIGINHIHRLFDTLSNHHLYRLNCPIFANLQQYTFITFRTWITGMERELNPTLGGTDLLYDLITKPSTTTISAASAAGPADSSGAGFSVVASAAPFSKAVVPQIAGRIADRGQRA